MKVLLTDIWCKRWQVVGTSGKEYTVALKRTGEYGCTCPAWIFQKNRPRVDCQHILHIKMKNFSELKPAEIQPQQTEILDNSIRSIRLKD